MVRFLRLSLTLATASSLFTGCAGQNATASGVLIAPVVGGLNARAATKQTDAPTVYAESRNAAGSTVVAVFANGGQSFTRKIQHGAPVVADSSGRVYIANPPVTVYSDAGKTLVQKFAVQNGPKFGVIAADGLGNFYVLCGHHDLCEYQIGNTGPIRELSASGFGSITTDSSGNLYLGISYYSVLVYAPGSLTPQRTITNGIAGPEALAVDPQGNLYVANTNSATNRVPNIEVYGPGSSAPSRTISDGLSNPIVIHTDPSGNLGVLNGYSDSKGPNITIYASGSNVPSKVITNGIDAPTSFAFDSSNNLYVSNIGATNSDPGSITAYAARSYSLTRTITKNINHSVSVAVGP